jgi:hypothetical protein
MKDSAKGIAILLGRPSSEDAEEEMAPASERSSEADKEEMARAISSFRREVAQGGDDEALMDALRVLVGYC